jgi:parallel beta-helix repeat protein
MEDKMNRGIVVVLVGMLVCVSFSVTSSATKVASSNPTPIGDGNVLYVGGSGPGNYTTIQAAVENASSGDTVFVYDDSSPYMGPVWVTKTLTIKGEDKTSTILEGDGFTIWADHVTITGFTIQNGETGVSIAGPSQTASYNTVDGNLFLNMTIGVSIFYGKTTEFSFSDYGYNQITNNVIRYSKWYGVRLCGSHNIATMNDIAPTPNFIPTEYGYGLGAIGIAFNNISYNTIVGNDKDGIYVESSYKDVIYRNNIKNNSRYGVCLGDASADKVLQNNFMGNRWDARMFNCPMISVSTHLGAHLVLPSIWYGNFWDKARIMPHPIGGLLFSRYFILGFITDHWDIVVNYLKFDLHPAQTPYEIPLLA